MNRHRAEAAAARGQPRGAGTAAAGALLPVGCTVADSRAGDAARGGALTHGPMHGQTTWAAAEPGMRRGGGRGAGKGVCAPRRVAGRLRAAEAE